MPTERTPLQEALDPRTSSRRLREIVTAARVSDAAEAVAAHPNAPPNLLEMLARWYPKAVLRNPALPLVTLEDPGWAQNLNSDSALSLLRFENVPVGLLSALAEKPDMVGSSARLHVGLTGEAGPDWENEVREALWSLPGREELFPLRLLTLDLVPDWLLEPLAAHSDSRVRRAVARSPRTPAGLLTPLRRAGSTSDLGGLAPPDLSLPVPVLERLARGGVWAKRLVARHPNTPSAILEALADHQKTQSLYEKDKALSRSLVQNPGTPAALRAAMAIEFDAEFRRVSARDSKTPQIALAALSTDAARDVRWMTARNPNTPVEALEVLAADADARVRQGVGRNAAVPPALLAVLAADPVRWVRLAAARHPLTPPDTLHLLAKDSDEEVRQSVARRDRPVPPRPENFRVKPPVKLPEPTRKQSLPNVDPAERTQALDAAAGSRSLLVRIAMLACPDTSPKLLSIAAADPRWPCRLAVARNPAAFLLSLAEPGTGTDLAALTRDGNRLVRAAARTALASAGEPILP